MAKTILIVDDNAYIRMSLCEQFKREADFEICGEAENGKEAIARALELHPDLIALDLSMRVRRRVRRAASPFNRDFRAGFQITACGYFGQQSPQSALSKRRVITSCSPSRENPVHSF